jgi:hypothetical protein
MWVGVFIWVFALKRYGGSSGRGGVPKQPNEKCESRWR